MKRLFALLALLMLFTLPTHQAHACTNDSLDTYALGFFRAYLNVTYGANTTNCTATMCGGSDRWWCRKGQNQWFWNVKGTQVCNYSGSSETYQVWHDIGGGQWTYGGANFTCSCTAPCHWN